ncbi:MAG: hypothetical protein WAW17_09600, partial [Rhodococcus sp. (in: high G+C Gram-positive bacteria)]
RLRALLWAPAETAQGTVAVLDAAEFHRPTYSEFYEVIAALVRVGAPHGTAMVGAPLEQDGKPFAGVSTYAVIAICCS